MKYNYTDEYLDISQEQETRAIKEIAQFKFKNEFYIEKLTILKAYIINCLENQTQKDDLYEIKLNHYKNEFSELLSNAKMDKANSKQENNLFLNNFNTPLYRG